MEPQETVKRGEELYIFCRRAATIGGVSSLVLPTPPGTPKRSPFRFTKQFLKFATSEGAREQEKVDEAKIWNLSRIDAVAWLLSKLRQNRMLEC